MSTYESVDSLILLNQWVLQFLKKNSSPPQLQLSALTLRLGSVLTPESVFSSQQRDVTKGAVTKSPAGRRIQQHPDSQLSPRGCGASVLLCSRDTRVCRSVWEESLGGEAEKRKKQNKERAKEIRAYRKKRHSSSSSTPTTRTHSRKRADSVCGGLMWRLHFLSGWN